MFSPLSEPDYDRQHEDPKEFDVDLSELDAAQASYLVTRVAELEQELAEHRAELVNMRAELEQAYKGARR